MDQKKAETPKMVRDRALRGARKTLNYKNNRLLLVVGILACILSTVSVFLLYEAFDIAFAFSGRVMPFAAMLVLDVTTSILCFFMVFPLYLGVARGAIFLSCGRPIEFSQFFVYYSSLRMFWRALEIQMCMALYAFPFLAIGIFKYLHLMGATFKVIGILAWVLTPVIPILLLLGFYTTTRIFSFAILALGDSKMSLGRALYYAKMATRGRFFSVCAMRIRFLWRFAVSLLSIGVVALIHTLPLILLAYGEYAAELVESADL